MFDSYALSPVPLLAVLFTVTPLRSLPLRRSVPTIVNVVALNELDAEPVENADKTHSTHDSSAQGHY